MIHRPSLLQLSSPISGTSSKPPTWATRSTTACRRPITSATGTDWTHLQLHMEQVFRRELLQSRRQRGLSAIAESVEHQGQPRPLRSRRAAEFQCRVASTLPTIPHVGERLGKGWQLSTILHRHQRTAFQRAAGRRRRSFGPGPVWQFYPGGLGRNSGQIQHPESEPVRGGELDCQRIGRRLRSLRPAELRRYRCQLRGGDIPLSPFYIPCQEPSAIPAAIS